MNTILKGAALSAVLSIAPSAFAGETRADKSLVVRDLAAKLNEAYKDHVKPSANRPKVVVAEVSNKTESLTAQDVELSIDKFESLLSKTTTVLDRKNTKVLNTEREFQHSGEVRAEDIAALNQVYGAQQLIIIGFRDQVGVVNATESNVTITAKITAIDVETKQIVLSETVELAYDHSTHVESYAMRDTGSFLLGVTSAVTGLGAIGAGIAMNNEKQKYDQATTANEATKYRNLTDRYQTGMYAALSVCTLSLLGKLYLDSRPRNGTIYHEYEISAAILPGRGFGLGLVWQP